MIDIARVVTYGVPFCMGLVLAWNIQGVRLEGVEKDYEEYRRSAWNEAVRAESRAREMQSKWIEEVANALREQEEHLEKVGEDKRRLERLVTGLRNDNAALRDRLAGASAETAVDTGLALIDVYERCVDAYRGMAETAQAHANDVATMTRAWPR
jgi:predicted RNase H-like nuclease (RuvC/YqgF family)